MSKKKKNRKIFVITEVILGILVIVLIWLMLWENKGKTLDRIAVMIPNADAGQWTAFQYGVRMAAKDYNVEVYMVNIGKSTDDIQDAVQQELENWADAVLVQAEDASQLGDTAHVYQAVVFDSYEMGQTLAQEIVQDYNKDITDKTFGIIAQSEESESISEREKGLCDTLKKQGCHVTWHLFEQDEEAKNSMIVGQKQVDVVVALDDCSLVKAAQCAATNDLKGARVYGISHSTDAIYDLDTENIKSMVVPDEFQRGYESMVQLVSRLKHKNYQINETADTYVVLNKENLFAKENQGLLYSMNQ